MTICRALTGSWSLPRRPRSTSPLAGRKVSTVFSTRPDGPSRLLKPGTHSARAIRRSPSLKRRCFIGQHLASSARFDDEYCDQYSVTGLEHAVRDYYANILMPFGALVKSKIAEIQKLGIEIDMIAPDHGIIWKKNPAKIIQMYLDMANDKADLRVVIVYDTMWHSTEHMTIPRMEGIKAAGVD